MAHNVNENELTERLQLIESMMAEGRRRTESWGWTFVLWGAAYFVAFAWATLGKSHLAWPVTMTLTGLITAIAASRLSKGHPETTMGRAVSGLWAAMGASLFLLLLSLGLSGRYEGHTFVAIIGAMLGLVNMASAIVLRWKAQFACAAIWLASTVVACFGSDLATEIAFLAATFIGLIAFGIYAMICESRRRRQSGVVHA